jgi:ribose transport system permease protein
MSATTGEARSAARHRLRLSARWVLGRRDVLVVYSVLGLMVALGRALSPNFLTSFNVQNVIGAAAPLALVAVGQTFVILTGGIDLSVGSTMSLTTVVAAIYMNGSDSRLAVGALMCIGIGAGLGLVNGLFVTVLKVEPIIATLGMMSIVQGLTFVRSMTPAGLTPPLLQQLIYGNVSFMPKPAIVIVAAFAAALFVLRKTRYGMRVYALGGGEESTRLSGVSTSRVKLSVYVLSGIFAALAGLLLAGRLGQGDPLAGQVFMLTSIAVVAIGGSSLFGGRGGLAGTLAGVLILTILGNLLNLEGVASYPQQLITGLLIIVVVALYSIGRLRLTIPRLPMLARLRD